MNIELKGFLHDKNTYTFGLMLWHLYFICRKLLLHSLASRVTQSCNLNSETEEAQTQLLFDSTLTQLVSQYWLSLTQLDSFWLSLVTSTQKTEENIKYGLLWVLVEKNRGQIREDCSKAKYTRGSKWFSWNDQGKYIIFLQNQKYKWYQVQNVKWK